MLRLEQEAKRKEEEEERKRKEEEARKRAEEENNDRQYVFIACIETFGRLSAPLFVGRRSIDDIISLTY